MPLKAGFAASAQTGPPRTLFTTAVTTRKGFVQALMALCSRARPGLAHRTGCHKAGIAGCG